MKPKTIDNITLIHADCMDVLKGFPDELLQTSVKVEAPFVKVEESKAEPKFKQ